MAAGPTFTLPDGFELPDSVDGDDFDALVTIRQMADGSAVLVAIDGNKFSPAPTPEPDVAIPEDPQLPGEPPAEDASALEAIESRLDGVKPSEITI